MANPSLKAQIEAAKSALASGTSANLVNTVPDQTDNETTAEKTLQQASPHEQTHTFVSNAEESTGSRTFESGAFEIDARITNLEKKLLASQQDLHELLSKIRKITDLQGNIKQKKQKHGDTNVALSFKRYLNTITISLLILACLIFSIIYFLPIEKSLLQIPIWIQQLVDVTSEWIG